MHSITADHVFTASLMTLAMTLAIVAVVGIVVYGLYRFFRNDDDATTPPDAP